MSNTIIHVIKDDLNTYCDLAWAINYIGCCRPESLPFYRHNDHVICSVCNDLVTAKYTPAYDRIMDKIYNVNGFLTAADVAVLANLCAILNK